MFASSTSTSLTRWPRLSAQPFEIPDQLLFIRARVRDQGIQLFTCPAQGFQVGFALLASSRDVSVTD